jgi:hypothetical protein
MKGATVVALGLVVVAGFGCAGSTSENSGGRNDDLTAGAPTASASSNTPSPAASSPSGAAPSLVTIQLEGALINAMKTGNACWDPGCDADASKAAFDACADIVSLALPPAAGYAQAVAVLGPFVAGAMSLPDVYGTATLFVGGKPSKTLQLQQVLNNLTPIWDGMLFEGVPLAAGTSVTIKLMDADSAILGDLGVDQDDPVGEFTLGVDDLRAAAQVGKTTQVNTGKQTASQVLFMNLTVLPETAKN